MPSFHIYKSSAGSGKTSQLVLSYLKLCLGTESPTYYRRILAITFTNKASNEMRERLIKELEKISSDKPGKEADYMVKSLMSELNIDLSTLSKRANAVFKDILQAYEQVSISTIDKFNHTLIKSFSRDLDIPNDFEVETAEKEIFAEAVDELINRVGKDEHVTKHLINFVQYKLDQERTANVRKALEDLFKLSVGESSYKSLDEIGKIDKEEFEDISRNLHTEIVTAQKRLKKLGERALELIQSAGLSQDDFSHGKAGVYGFFKKLTVQNPLNLSFSKRAENALDGSWMNKSAPSAQLAALDTIQDDLHNILVEVHSFFETEIKDLKLKNAVRSNIDLIAVLTALSEIFKDLCNRKKVIPISRFNKLISDALRKEPVSFIYEQIGARYDHILIDEFQDTSQLQWYNLLPLVDEAISRGKYNMVVGDAKQSIYRWRGGKAEQLIDLPRLFEPPSDILPEIEGNLIANSSIERLQINYRSLDGIVNFNNELIEKLSALCIPNNTIYADEYNTKAFRQKPREGQHGGYIEINEIEKSDEDNDWSNLLDQISFCKRQGYTYGDMAILVRSARKEGKSITRALLNRNIPVISKESYDISEYQPVKIVLGLLKLSIDLNHNPSKIRVIKGFSRLLKKDVNYGQYKSGKQLDINTFLAENKMEPFNGFNNLSVFDAIEEIHSKYLQNLNHPALSTLKESVFSRFGLKGSIADFFEYWDNLNEKPSINFGDSGNSIELLTIHKAKGLQYKVVFLPELAWRLRSVHTELAWFSMEHHPIELPFAPLPINSKLSELGLDKEYNDEENANHFDNLNLVYVALTRAEEALFITTYDKGANTVGKWMTHALESLIDTSSIPEIKIEPNEVGRKVIIGHLEPQNTELTEGENDNIDYMARKPHPWKENLEFANVQEMEGQNLGKVFHEIVSKAKDQKSFDALLKRKLHTGNLLNEEMEQLLEFGYNLFSNQTYQEFLQGGKVITERDILHEGKIIRPDMVIEKESEQIVLDFKTGEEKNSHREQLLTYMNACKILRPVKVSGYLIYLNPFRLVQVEASQDQSQMKLF